MVLGLERGVGTEGQRLFSDKNWTKEKRPRSVRLRGLDFGAREDSSDQQAGLLRRLD